ncbi:MAG: hypothetical protein AAFR38_08010 [Planctomycetota bacterium]
MKTMIATLATVAGSAAGQVTLYSADFSQIVSIDHTTTGNALESSPQNGANFTLSYPSTPASDTTRNFFETTGNSLISSDFGGAHRFESFDIDVSNFNSVDVDFLADFVGTASFNNSPTEFFQYFFTLDNGADQELFFFTDDPNGPNLNFNGSIDVSGASTLTIGINANANGAGDGFELTSAIVSGTPIPAPGVAAIAGVAGLAAARRRRA